MLREDCGGASAGKKAGPIVKRWGATVASHPAPCPPIDSAEQALQLIDPGSFARTVAGAALLHRTLELFEQLLLLRRQVHRRFDTDAAIKIAGVSAAHVAHA